NAMTVAGKNDVGDLFPFARGGAAIVERHHAGGLAIGVVAARLGERGFFRGEFRDDVVDLIWARFANGGGEASACNQEKTCNEAHRYLLFPTITRKFKPGAVWRW